MQKKLEAVYVLFLEYFIVYFFVRRRYFKATWRKIAEVRLLSAAEAWRKKTRKRTKGDALSLPKG
ncbi:hypothetical protein [Sinomicrobium weinanense]|uniref:Uncharacterized protein n=1 Tax=Sinomicrobium weinanense TaxID=2842200 RepID=A0A926JNX3_9FLAO|nr:hypothetical protein [Sinomicrobium weinanense]MBC9794571.1 hypothetical protein [Sinomicrobium weinanense]MBU3124056.1 hypothetical protein [Sinomicrobium weinanense]